MKIEYEPIGVIHTPFKQPKGTPVQPAGARGARGTIEVFAPYADGLRDLEGFSHIMLLYHFDRATRGPMIVTPFMDTEPRGVFATRAPRRPNPIGVSVVVLARVDGRVLHVENVDMLDGTPLLDIKPYVPEFDHHRADRVGWLEQARGRVRTQQADDRFA